MKDEPMTATEVERLQAEVIERWRALAERQAELVVEDMLRILRKHGLIKEDPQ